MPDLIAYALAAARRGWHVFPLVPRAKTPAIKGWPDLATTDPEQIQSWWRRPCNLGIATGPSRLVVVDLDIPKTDQDTPPEEWALPGVADGANVLAVLAERAHQPYPRWTFTVTTPSGGTHLYFTHPDQGPELRNTCSGIGWKVDTRAAGGMVVGPGSTTAAGAYRVVNPAPAAPLPGWLHKLLTPPPRPAIITTAPRRSTGRGYVTSALDNETHAVETAPKELRNAALVRAARALARFIPSGELTRDQVEDALRRSAVLAGVPERKAMSVITSAVDWSITHDRRIA